MIEIYENRLSLQILATILFSHFLHTKSYLLNFSGRAKYDVNMKIYLKERWGEQELISSFS